MSRINVFTNCNEEDRQRMHQMREVGEFFWLDLRSPTHETINEVGDYFGWHPLLIEDLEHRGQRPKVEEFADCVFIIAVAAVFLGDPQELELHEFALVVHGDYLVTISHDAPKHFDRLRELASQRDDLTEAALVHRVLDRIVDVTLETSEGLGTYVEQLEVAIDHGTSHELLVALRGRRRELVRARSMAVAQRDALESLSGLLEQLKDFEHGMHDHFRDVVDHARRVVDDLEVGRLLLDDAFEAYYTMLVAHQGNVARRLTIVATIFLPLTFVTGFFGQNFGWMVDHIADPGDFVIFGVGGSLGSAIVLMFLFKVLKWW